MNTIQTSLRKLAFFFEKRPLLTAVVSVVFSLVLVCCVIVANWIYPNSAGGVKTVSTPTPIPALNKNIFRGTDNVNEFYVAIAPSIYKYNVATKEKTKLPINAGTGVMSPDNNLIAYIEDATHVGIYNVVKGNTYKPKVIRPSKGDLGVEIKGFSLDSTKLLFNVDCYVHEDDSLPTCTDDFKANNTGFYVYDVVSGTTKKLDLNLDFIAVSGWSKRNAESIVLIKIEKDADYKSETIKLYEMNVLTNATTFVKTITTNNGSLTTVYDIDKDYNVLHIEGTGNGHLEYEEMYLNNLLIQKATWTGIQRPTFINAESEYIAYYDNSQTNLARFVIIDRVGNIVFEKKVTYSSEWSFSSKLIAGRYMELELFNTGVTIYDCLTGGEVVNFPNEKIGDDTVRPEILNN
jgi:hypothetical protein